MRTGRWVDRLHLLHRWKRSNCSSQNCHHIPKVRLRHNYLIFGEKQKHTIGKGRRNHHDLMDLFVRMMNNYSNTSSVTADSFLKLQDLFSCKSARYTASSNSLHLFMDLGQMLFVDKHQHRSFKAPPSATCNAARVTSICLMKLVPTVHDEDQS